jgi:hypothetical protein
MYEELAKRFSITTARVEEEYKKIAASFPTDTGMTQAEIETEILGGLQFHLGALTGKSKGELLIGMVLAVDKIKDQANPTNKVSRRNQNVDAYVANPADAVATGKVATLKVSDDGSLIRTMKDKKTGEVVSDVVTDGIWDEQKIAIENYFVVPLDEKATWTGGAKNISYLRALPLHQYKTSIIIVLKTTAGYKLAELAYNSDKLPGKIPMYVPIEFVATVKEEKDGVLHLGTSKLTSFEPINIEFGKTPKELLDAFLTPIRYPIMKLSEYHQAMVAAGNQWDTLVMIEGWVGEIKGLDKTPFLVVGDTSTVDTSQHIRVFLHDGLLPVTYAQNSKVYIIGRTSQGDKYDPETKKTVKGVLGDVTIWAMGVYAKYNAKPVGVKPVTGVTL